MIFDNKRPLKLLLASLMLNSFVYASENVPTETEVAKLYVATFNRAPDSAGLGYWTNQSGLKLSGIAQSFFDQSETQTLYPTSTSNSAFVTSVYDNLFNRVADTAGLDYWVNQLDTGAFSKNRFIEAVIAGAQNTATSNDADILTNKTTTGLSFAKGGLDDVASAKTVMSGITDDTSTITAALSSLGVSQYAKENLSGEITANTTLTANKVWVINGLVAVKNSATLTIEAGTTIIGKEGTGANTSYMVIDKDSKIMAEGTAASPIIFTSETAYDGGADAVGQWGGLTIIGNAGNAQVEPYEVNSNFVAGSSNLADNSGTLTHVKILNSGITMEENKEINGLSMVGVGSGTTVSNITVTKSDDDCVEIWGGTVNLDGVTLAECTDDHFDIDDGYTGTVKNLTVNATTGNAGIEMSGETAATFDGFTINMTNSAKEGGIYFKKDGIGGHFKNGTVNYNTADNGYGAVHSAGTFDSANTSFSSVTLAGSNTSKFTGDSASGIQAIFDGTSTTLTKENLSGEITANTTLTANKVWVINGLVAVKNSATLTIEAGTTIIGKEGTGANTSYMVIDKDSKIMAEGTAASPIIFTSETAYDGGADAVGQWGGLTIIGNAGNAQVEPYEVNSNFVAGSSNLADNSGTLTHVKILNSGITMEENKEINGLSMVGVGSGTTVSNITVTKSDDDCVEIWGGTVNLDGVTLAECTDDHFDIDDGYTGTVKNLTVNATTGNAGIEMSGETAATFDGFTINMTNSAKEGGIYFKKDGIGGHFKNGTVNYNTADNGYGAVHSAGTFDSANTSFSSVTLAGSNTSKFTGDSASGIEGKFDTGTSNTK